MIALVPGEFYTPSSMVGNSLYAFLDLDVKTMTAEHFAVRQGEPFVALTTIESRGTRQFFEILSLKGEVGWLLFETTTDVGDYIQRYNER